MHVSRIATFLFGTAVLLANAGDASLRTCTRQEAIQAETDSSSLKTWRDIYRSFRLYHHCDDGAISDDYSSSVASLLADRWDQARDLNALARRDPEFLAFVLHHVDETPLCFTTLMKQ